jgi:predicted hotdog family 3-hydroxylacyl-ACP dehydratase
MTSTNVATQPSLLDAAAIARLIPHNGSMSLLDTVDAFDAHHIHCSAVSHRHLTNPLRENNMLHAVCGVEYAAQAMAVHGALLATNSSSEPRGGRLASVRAVEFFTDRIDTVEIKLDIFATLLLRDDNSMMYEFTISTPHQTLLQGKATVILMPKESE